MKEGKGREGERDRERERETKKEIEVNRRKGCIMATNYILNHNTATPSPFSSSPLQNLVHYQFN